jgi:hypothetical protein
MALNMGASAPSVDAPSGASPSMTSPSPAQGLPAQGLSQSGSALGGLGVGQQANVAGPGIPAALADLSGAPVRAPGALPSGGSQGFGMPAVAASQNFKSDNAQNAGQLLARAENFQAQHPQLLSQAVAKAETFHAQHPQAAGQALARAERFQAEHPHAAEQAVKGVARFHAEHPHAIERAAGFVERHPQAVMRVAGMAERHPQAAKHLVGYAAQINQRHPGLLGKLADFTERHRMDGSRIQRVGGGHYHAASHTPRLPHASQASRHQGVQHQGVQHQGVAPQRQAHQQIFHQAQAEPRGQAQPFMAQRIKAPEPSPTTQAAHVPGKALAPNADYKTVIAHYDALHKAERQATLKSLGPLSEPEVHAICMNPNFSFDPKDPQREAKTRQVQWYTNAQAPEQNAEEQAARLRDVANAPGSTWNLIARADAMSDRITSPFRNFMAKVADKAGFDNVASRLREQGGYAKLLDTPEKKA